MVQLDDMRRKPTQFNRQQFIRGSLAAGLTLPVLAGVLSACGSSDDESSATAGTSRASTTAGAAAIVGTEAIRTPKASGPLGSAKWALTYEPTSLYWTAAYAPVENTVIANVTESLMRLTPEFTYEPSLAESMDVPDERTYVFTLREGVRFHDGSTMTADDVVFSIEQSRLPTSYWAPWLSAVDNVKATGDLEVTVKLTRPDVMFPQWMALPPGAVGSAAAIRAGGRSYGSPKSLPVGTGPFSVARWNAGSDVVLAKFDGYWDSANPAITDTVEFSFLSDATTMVNALVAGDVDGAYYLPYDALQRLQDSRSGEIYQGPSMLNAIMFWTTKDGPQLDPRVRQAWLLATDRTAIASSVYNNAAAPLPSTFVPLPVWGYVREAAQAAYEALPGPAGDPEKALALFKAAGSPTEPMKIAIKSGQLDEQIGTILQAAAQSIGLSVEIVKMPAPELINLLYDERARTQYNAFVTGGYYGDIPDPVQLFASLIGKPAEGALSYNYLEWRDAEVQGLIERANQTADEDARGALLIEAQKLQAESVPVFPIVAPASLVYLNGRVSGVPASFCYNYYPWARDLGAA